MYDGISKINVHNSALRSSFNDYPTTPVLLPGISQIFSCTEMLQLYYIWTGFGLLKSEMKFSKSGIHTENYYSTVYSFMFSKEYLLNGLKIFRVLPQVFISGPSLA